MVDYDECSGEYSGVFSSPLTKAEKMHFFPESENEDSSSSDLSLENSIAKELNSTFAISTSVNRAIIEGEEDLRKYGISPGNVVAHEATRGRRFRSDSVL
jgi:hypothetical protein